MIRGNAQDFKFKLKNGESYISADDYDDIELQFNPQSINASVKKLMSKEEITYDSENHSFSAYLSQEETFRLNEGMAKVQIRLLKDNDGKKYVKGTVVSHINIGEVLSNEILGGAND